MNDPWTDRLSDFLDGELTAGEAERLERHLVTCRECRETVAQLRTVVERAAALGERQPPRDLWPGIVARIGVSGSPEGSRRGQGLPERERGEEGERRLEARPRPRPRLPRRFSFSLPQLAAAAVAIVLLSGTMVWLLSTGPGNGLGPGTVAVDDRPPRAGLGDAALAGMDERVRAGGYDEAITQLETILFYGEEALDTATVRTLRESLDAVDRAIEDARTALAEDPGNSYLQQHLGQTMRKKAEFLRQAVTLVATDG